MRRARPPRGGRTGAPGTDSCMTPDRSTDHVPRSPALLLGVGLGGFVDGIVLHQVLHWHHVLTATERWRAVDDRADSSSGEGGI